MICLISLGLFDKKDISFKALELAKKCDELYIELYTGYFNTSLEELSKFFGKDIVELNRQQVESDFLIKKAKDKKIGLLVTGDALTATTHISLLLDAKKQGIKTKVVHGSSILTAIAETGLILYNFGKIASIPLNNEDVETPYDVLKENKELHTLFLLDLKDKYMKVSEAIEYLLKIEDKRKENIFTKDKLCIVVASLGSENSKILAGKASELLNLEIKEIPQVLIVPGKLHFIEEEYINLLLKSDEE